MIDYNQPIKTAIYHKLNGNILNDLQPVNICKGYVDGLANYPYVIISEQNNQSNRSKSNQGSSSTVEIQIVTGFTGSIDESIANNISNQILKLLNPSNKIFISPGQQLQIVDTDLVLDRGDTMQNGQYKIFRRILILSFIIQEKIFI